MQTVLEEKENQFFTRIHCRVPLGREFPNQNSDDFLENNTNCNVLENNTNCIFLENNTNCSAAGSQVFSWQAMEETFVENLSQC